MKVELSEPHCEIFVKSISSSGLKYDAEMNPSVLTPKPLLDHKHRL